MITASPITTLFNGRSRDEALESWREAADSVGMRWQGFLQADSESRPWMFALYVAALDAEEAAAAELAALALADLAA